MAENIATKKMRSYSLKPIFILTIAAILISKAQKAVTEESSILTTTTDSSSDDQRVCPSYCNLPPDRATRGKAPFRMWYFDPSEGGCRRFRWGGRGGNKNRFNKKADCEETCSKCTFGELLEEGSSQENQKSDLIQDATCSPSLDEGRCDQGQDKPSSSPQMVWYYNKEKAKCTPFIFYGCGGNSNRFASQKDCEETCH